MRGAQLQECRPRDRKRLGSLERDHRRRPPALRAQHRQQAEDIARAVQRDGRGVAERRDDAGGEAPGLDPVQAVAGIVAVKDDLTAVEPPPPSRPPQFLLGNRPEGVWTHMPDSTPWCDRCH